MPVKRDNPYGTFNFHVTIDGNEGGFQEVSGLNVDLTIAEYRNGNEKVNHTRKVTGMYKVGDVTLKRGLMGADDLNQWLIQTRTGDPKAPKTVKIEMIDELGQNPVATWTLLNARPMKYTAPSLNAKGGTDVAIEELVLACEDITPS